LRESIRQKALRYIAEERIRVRVCSEDDGTVEADVRGHGRVYATGRDATGWFCDCAARGECCHITALRLVTVLEPRRPA
jgi:uncharacterized Zn finger protein